MQLTVSPEEKMFREEARTWLNENVPKDKPPAMGQEHREYQLAWQRKQFDGGWAGIDWPKEYGGRGLSIMEQVIWFEEYVRAEAPLAGCMFIALKHGGPTLILRADEAQKSYHLPRILQGEVVWCQGFSEPGAGSDLAGIRTRGVVDGDHLVVNGSKIWTSFGQVADFQELVIRTDPDSIKHKGLSWVICDMKAPGITVRPILAMDGEYQYCEVFYDDVRIPLTSVVGGLGNGWSVAMSTLSFERGTSFIQAQLELSRAIDGLVELAESRFGPDGRPIMRDEAFSSRIAMLRGEVAALRSMTYMAASRGSRQEFPGPEGTFLPLFYGELSQRVFAAIMDVLGAEGLMYSAADPATWPHKYMRALANTITGGTSEIRRNIVGERVLGLPR